MAVRTGLTERFVLLLLSSLLGLARKRRGQRGGTGVCRSFVSQRPFLLISVLSRGVRSRTGPRRLHPCLSSSFSHARHAVSSVALAFSFFLQSFENWQAIFPGGNIVVRFFEARLKTAFISAREFREMFVETAIVETACSEIIGDQQFFESGRRRRQNLLSSASLGETAGGEKTRLEGDDEQERARASERAARGNLRTRHRRREHKRRERPTTFFFGFLFFHRLLLLSFFFISFISFHIIWVLSL